MTMIKESNIPELVDEMEKYSFRIQKMSSEEARQALIRIGVLKSDGQPKEQICTGNNYAG